MSDPADKWADRLALGFALIGVGVVSWALKVEPHEMAAWTALAGVILHRHDVAAAP